MFTKVTKLLLLCLAICFYSCSDDTTTEPDDKVELKPINYPIETGNEWTYSEVFINNSGEITEESGNSVHYKVGNEVNFRGKMGYEIIKTKIFAGNAATIDTVLRFNDADGLYEYDRSLENQIREEYPQANIGWVKLIDYAKESWTSYETYVDTIINNVEYYYTLVITGKRVGTKTVKVGEDEYTGVVFNIKEVYTRQLTGSSRSTTYEYEMILIDNVGMFGDREINTSGNGSWGLTLKNFNIN